ncbi:MAG: DUF3848 domain-containing protein [Dorea sp.]
MLHKVDNQSVQEKNFRAALGSKLALEYLQFKRRMVLLSPEEVFANAYRIDIYINLYEALLEMAESFSLQELEQLVPVPDLLGNLYEGWLKIPDSQQEEIREYLKKTVRKEQEELE